MKIRKKKLILLSVIITALTILFFLSGILNSIELLTYDYRVLINSLLTPNTQDKIVIVKIDQKSLYEIGEWPWSRDIHAKLIEMLNKEGAEIIGFDIFFDLPTEDKIDNLFMNRIKKAENVVLPYILNLKTIRDYNFLIGLFSNEKIKVDEIKYPLELFRKEVGALGYLNLVQDKDGKIRRVRYISDQYTPFSFELARQYSAKNKDLIKKEPLINYHYRNDYFEEISYGEVLKHNFPSGFFENKIVLIGATDDALRDYLMTPMVSAKGYLPGVMIHAEIIDNYLENSFFYELNRYKVIILISFFTFIVVCVYGKLTPLQSIIFTLLACIFISIVGFLFLFKLNIFLPIVPFILIVIFSFIAINLLSYLQSEQNREHLEEIFSRYLSPKVIQKVIRLGDKDYLAGERRDITVVFIDLVDFTSFSEKNSPTEVVGMLNKYFSIIVEETFKLEGTLDKFLGDGAMIFFNAPSKQDDHAELALILAQRLQRRISQDLRLALEISIGINTGQAIVGNIGSTKRSDYTAIGDVVNTASRIEGLAGAGEIIVGEKTYQLIKYKYKVELKKNIKLKGKINKSNLYKIIAEKGE
ncbi:CHASE2 domain-containing protein [Orenia marismortui]|uniref:Adenylate cyclase n=1 Tax=Orenia marismortui TaxID=46469 RepID=A0A4R8H9B2_9FIRM|nr:adenylate/guanylate cyclase domain-containing protein [Orenia marismortui]TDX51634.1 adenylate cyclase [Orenia marismortui]